MDSSRPASAPAAAGAVQTPAALAKGALRRLAMARLEPTPANFARAYAEEAGETAAPEAALPARARPLIERLAARASDDAALRAELAGAVVDGRWDDLQRALDRGAEAASAQSQAWATLIERLARALERGSRTWTPGRKKDSLQRVLEGSRSDAQRLQQRLRQLIASWEDDRDDEAVEVLEGETAPAEAAAEDKTTLPVRERAGEAAAATGDQARVVAALNGALQSGLPPDEPRAAELADELAVLAQRIAGEGATPALADAVVAVCERVRRLFGHRHDLVEELMALCRSLTDGLTELAEDDSWARGQSEGLRARLDAPTGSRAVRAARELLADTRERQRALREERQRAREALKAVIQTMLSELGELDTVTGSFGDKIGRYADVIEAADSLDSLASVVREMVDESRAVHRLVAGARDRLATEHARAGELQQRVLALENELRRLSNEVSTDALTQVANRRGMEQAFEAERARIERAGDAPPPLAVGLLDIDNFKKLNDTLGHAAGDVALRSLAARVKDGLRPVDHIARFGGEEFVVLLTGTPVDEAQQVLTRLQRQLSASLFMHDGREVFVTFSAGVTAYRPGEALALALERADEALYEAKRTGKNRTCIA